MNTLKLITDILFEFGLFINAALMLPQAIKIIRYKSAQNISLTTYIGFTLIQLAMLLYSLLQQDIWLITGTIPNLGIDVWITFLIVKYNNLTFTSNL